MPSEHQLEREAWAAEKAYDDWLSMRAEERTQERKLRDRNPLEHDPGDDSYSERDPDDNERLVPKWERGRL